MTIATTSNKAIGQGNGAATNWPFTFLIPDQTSLVVIYTDATGLISTIPAGQYTVAGLNDPNGGSVTYPLSGGPIAAGTTLTVLRTVAYNQQRSVKNQSGFFPDVYEAALDYLTMQTQQINETLGRAIVASSGDLNPLMALPAAAARANSALGFDAAGNVAILNKNTNIASFSPSTWVLANVAAMKGLSNIQNGVVVQTRGYTTQGDGGASLYVFNATDASADNGGSVLAPSGGGAGRWNLMAVGIVRMEQFGVLGDGTDETAKIMKAFTYVNSIGGGTVHGTPGKTYVCASLWPLNGVKFDLNGATLKLATNAAGGIIDHGVMTYAPTPSARVDFRSYIPSDPNYTGSGFYQMAAGTKAAGTNSIVTNTAADAGNFAAGDLAIVISGPNVNGQWVAESVEIESGTAGTGVVKLRWPLHKWHKSGGAYFGIAKRDAGYTSGKGFQIKNGTLDAGTSNEDRYLINYEGMKMDFIDLEFKGEAYTYYNIRGTKCRLIRARMNCRNGTYAGHPEPFSIDQGATDNVCELCTFDVAVATEAASIHLGEPHSDTKFLYCSFNFPPRSVVGGGAGQLGTTGLTFIGCKFLNPQFGAGNGWTTDGTPTTQIWIGNEFFGQFTFPLLYLTSPGTTPDPTIGHVKFVNNTAIGTFVTALVPGGNDNVIRGLSNCTIEGNHIRIVDSVTGIINKTDYTGIDFDTVTVRGNKGLPDMERYFFSADNVFDITGATRVVNNFIPTISYPDAVTDTGWVRTPINNLGGKVVFYGRLKLTNLGAGAGDVVFRTQLQCALLGTATASVFETVNKTITAAAQNVPVTSGAYLLAQAYPNGFIADYVNIEVGRLGANGADTLANAIGMLSFELIKVPYTGY